MTETERWLAVIQRDRQFDGRFVFAVSSTGIYCRPSCPSRRPKRQNVRFYSVPGAAEAEGYRACLRCRPEEADVADPRTAMVQSVCRIIDEDPASVPGLEALATAAGVSAGHLRRTFKRIVGITPREYAEARRLALLKDDLRTRRTVTEAQFQAGFGSSSRLYERSSKQLGMTPATYRRGGAGARISFAITTCTMGHLLVAATERGICSVKLGDEEHELETQLRSEFAAGEIQRDDASLAQWIAAVADLVEAGREIADLPLDVVATAFQWRVWQLLQEIPRGETRTYGELARTLRSPRAARAVARACATNPVALVIPCHRVVPARGDAGGYRWGPHRKERLLEREQRAAALDGRYDLE